MHAEEVSPANDDGDDDDSCVFMTQDWLRAKSAKEDLFYEGVVMISLIHSKTIYATKVRLADFLWWSTPVIRSVKSTCQSDALVLVGDKWISIKIWLWRSHQPAVFSGYGKAYQSRGVGGSKQDVLGFPELQVIECLKVDPHLSKQAVAPCITTQRHSKGPLRTAAHQRQSAANRNRRDIKPAKLNGC